MIGLNTQMRCCKGYRCSIRLPIIGGICIRDQPYDLPSALLVPTNATVNEDVPLNENVPVNEGVPA